MTAKDFETAGGGNDVHGAAARGDQEGLTGADGQAVNCTGAGQAHDHKERIVQRDGHGLCEAVQVGGEILAAHQRHRSIRNFLVRRTVIGINLEVDGLEGKVRMELAGLSFLGLGAKPPTAEWGNMMSEARGLLQTAPWAVFAPGVAIFVAVLVFNLLGDAIRDYMDPKMRE